MPNFDEVPLREGYDTIVSRRYQQQQMQVDDAKEASYLMAEAKLLLFETAINKLEELAKEYQSTVDREKELDIVRKIMKLIESLKQPT